jgi:hypothetical protein
VQLEERQVLSSSEAFDGWMTRPAARRQQYERAAKQLELYLSRE